MKRKGKLWGGISAFVLGLVLFVSILYSKISPNFDESNDLLISNAEILEQDWLQNIMKDLGSFEALPPINNVYFKKEIFIIDGVHPLSDYQNRLESFLKKSNFRFQEHIKKSKEFNTLLVLIEQEKHFLRIIEIKKRIGLMVENIPDTAVSENESENLSQATLNPVYISIVIDDVGRDKELESEFLSYPYPLTFAIIPFELYTQSFAHKAKQQNREVIIHAPMEGDSKTEPYFELTTKLKDEEIKLLLDKYQKEIPSAVGLNNHQGSVATANRFFMTRFFHHFKQKSLYFLDSRTTEETVAAQLAKKEGIRTFERDIFLDNQDDKNYISSQIFKLIELAKKKNGAIGIGHFTKPKTLQVLKDFVPYFKENNIQIVPLSQLGRKKT